MDAPAEENAAQHRDQRDGDERRRQHRERLGEGERLEQLAFLAGQRKDRHERQQDDRHREEHRPPDQPRRVEDRLHDRSSIARVDPSLLDDAEGVLGDDDAGIHQHADGDGDPGEAHDVGGDAGVVHPQERREHGQRQRNA